MASQPSRPTRGTSTADLETEERRGWLSHGIAALAISALGLAVAASASLTTSAQTTTENRPQTALTTGGHTLPEQTLPQQKLPQQKLPGKAGSGSAVAANAPELEAFLRRGPEGDEESRSSVREAIVEERAAQRSEDLTESAEKISRAALEQGKSARLQELAKTDRARRVAAVKIAQERTRKAIQARVTAEVQRELAAAKASNSTDSTDSTGSDQASTPAPETPVDSSDIPSGGGARSPVPGAIVGASFGATGAWARYHTGLDFRAGFGTPIRAVTSGVVVYSGNKGNWAGNHVAVRHAGGYTSMSSHMQSMAVRAGQTVEAGQVIGYVGSTGRSFGAHLHFEIYPPGVQPGNVYSAINPIPWLRARGVDTN